MEKQTDTMLDQTWTIQKVLEKFNKNAGAAGISGFIVNPENEHSFMQIVAYFLRQEKFEGNPNKGILLLGPIGTGKTTAIKIIQGILKGYKDFFQLVESRHIIRDFMLSGMDEIDKYGRNSYHVEYSNGDAQRMPTTYCFDDLGLENTDASLYGNKANVISEIMLDRYNGFISHGMKTHCISNLDPKGLAAIYGDRAADRFTQMFNIIVFKGSSFRK